MNSDFNSLSLIIAKDFELASENTESALRCQLIHAFAYLLDHDISKMMNILYRADVNEEKLKSDLKTWCDLPAAEVIADSYINRQKQKLETWKKYSQ
jgi:hypothetical protein